MTRRELAERAYRAEYEIRKAGRDVGEAILYISPEDWYDLRADRDISHPAWSPEVKAVFGIPIAVDTRLEAGDMRLRWEVAV